jgi:hypothetical protein
MRVSRRILLPALAAAAAGAPARADPAPSFVMLERHDCPWCRRWHREIGPIWPQSDLGRRAPLRRVDIGAGPLPPDLAVLGGARFTPTFVLMSGGAELVRIIGYQGDLFFWRAAEALFSRLPQADTTPHQQEKR